MSPWPLPVLMIVNLDKGVWGWEGGEHGAMTEGRSGRRVEKRKSQVMVGKEEDQADGRGEGENGDAKWQRRRRWLRREGGWYQN